MEPGIKPTPASIPNRRKTIRREEGRWKLRHTNALDTLLPDVIYDVKAILTTVYALTRELKEDIGTMEEASTADRQAFKKQWGDGLDFINHSIKRLIDEMKQVRLYTQASQVPIRTLVERLIENWRTFAEKKGISIKCQGLENLPAILGYERQLQSVFVSVIVRATHVTQPSGSVMVSGRFDQTQGTAIVEVNDTGPAVTSQLCDAFNRGEELDVTEIISTNAGHMFDLQGARKIVAICGGRISIESSKGSGTKCSIYFPLT